MSAPDDRIREKDAEAFAVTALACAAAGWEFRRVGEVDQVLVANVRWLSRYRHPALRGPSGILENCWRCSRGGGLFAGAATGRGPAAHAAGAVSPDVARQLVAGLASGLLGPATLVRRVVGVRTAGAQRRQLGIGDRVRVDERAARRDRRLGHAGAAGR